ncbi:FAD-dependent 5-carboxymethylaminomethyl-2-thiouridine(34) oxidoreductase MnmC [Glaciimonas immobilis]|uniref:tRNA 5-methylaminomethyl-2-thiouridine biosynthesis bifunctional protein MnmC n=1 Tax=Glaciimonas immobilis TaxID=728004 RepID=A0A840RYU2_9BURK|nr:FAD-dependent 5-carboxymethylaminomethyl-2-thiouridine(34) oxidoreductase MnmC [Glaciimonas immobilis]KAF3997244.1 FAD-dependent 5-carboxymethylaminomethyl-2-thiouridine(34) oxidoreductase MnmC [Glaciimonas immobilis]MBB5202298.1 tRNA 5-methylaminomethyl-2-thiouridine biosynthesis bifunctional protein [Glaciimonas immobilis]
MNKSAPPSSLDTRDPAKSAIAPNALIGQWQQQRCFTLLDTAFEAGQNFLATWQLWRDHPEQPQQLHYLALLPTPLSIADLAQAHETWPAWAQLADALRAVWPILVPGFHRLYLDNNAIVLTLMIGDGGKCLRQISATVDAFYVHGAVARDWAPPMLARLGRLANTHAKLTIFDLTAVKQKVLEAAGFMFDAALPADAMPVTSTTNTTNSANPTNATTKDSDPAQAYFLPRWKPALSNSTIPSQRHAIIIGAGLAGAAACQRLALRGWRVTLIERHAAIAQEASGNAAGIFMPVLSRDDNPTARLSRSAYLFARHVWDSLGGIGDAISGAHCGVLQIARDAVHADAQARWALQAHLPVDYARWLSQPAASALLGTTTSHGGWLFPAGGWVHPLSLCAAMLQACGEHVQTHFNIAVTRLKKTANGWDACDGNGATIASAPVVILANGMGALHLAQTHDLPLVPVRGQVTYVNAGSAPTFTQVLCGDGYLTPLINGVSSAGASYNMDLDAGLRQTSQDENIARLQKILPAWNIDGVPLPLAGRVGFRCVSADRLPLVGALPDLLVKAAMREPQLKQVPRLGGLYGLLGFASRGLIWAPLAAELLAAELNGEPLPIEAELAAALDPARFMLKVQRRGSALT